MINEIERAGLFSRYNYRGKKGNWKSEIYILNNDLIIGKGLSNDGDFMMTGFKNQSELKLIRLIENKKNKIVYWDTEKKINFYEGGFAFIPIKQGEFEKTYLSIKNSFNSLENRHVHIENLIFELTDKMKKNYFDPHLNGSGELHLNN